jgi:hypothetical protein
MIEMIEIKDLVAAAAGKDSNHHPAMAMSGSTPTMENLARTKMVIDTKTVQDLIRAEISALATLVAAEVAAVEVEEDTDPTVSLENLK